MAFSMNVVGINISVGRKMLSFVRVLVYVCPSGICDNIRTGQCMFIAAIPTIPRALPRPSHIAIIVWESLGADDLLRDELGTIELKFQLNASVQLKQEHILTWFVVKQECCIFLLLMVDPLPSVLYSSLNLHQTMYNSY